MLVVLYFFWLFVLSGRGNSDSKESNPVVVTQVRGVQRGEEATFITFTFSIFADRNQSDSATTLPTSTSKPTHKHSIIFHFFVMSYPILPTTIPCIANPSQTSNFLDLTVWDSKMVTCSTWLCYIGFGMAT